MNKQSLSSRWLPTIRSGINKYSRLLAILLLAALLRAIFLQGVLLDLSVQISKDSWSLSAFDYSGGLSTFEIVRHPRAFLQSIFVLPSEFWLVSLGTSIAYTLFGVNEYSSAAFPIAASLLLVPLLYLLGTYLFGKTAGHVAAYLWAVMPIGIFLSTNLLPVLPNLLLDVLAIFLFFRLQKNQSLVLNAFLLITLTAGLIIDWTFFLPTATFILIFRSTGRDSTRFARISMITTSLALIVLFSSSNATKVLDLYYLSLRIFDNFLVIPLVLITIVIVAKASPNPAFEKVLVWLGLKFLFVIIIAQQISESLVVGNVGMGGYWLSLLMPSLLIIGWHMSQKIKLTPTPNSVNVVISGIVYLALLAFAIVKLPLPEFVLTTSRISVGFAFLIIPGMYLLLWNRSKQTLAVLFSSYIVLFLLASLSITQSYNDSYAYSQGDMESSYQYLDSVGGNIDLFLPQGDIYDRYMYMTEYKTALQNPEMSLSIMPFRGFDDKNISEGDYVLLFTRSLKFVLGPVPENWLMVEEFQSSDLQNLKLFRVDH